MFKLIVASTFFVFTVTAQSQQNGGAANPAPAAAAPAVAPAGVLYTMLQPTMQSVMGTLQGLRIDKWKKGSVRDEAAQNVEALQRDIQNNVPPLVSAADAAPGSVSKAIPLVKHLDALYDVLLRVEEASRVIAPGEQVGELQQALLKLSSARMTLDDQLQNQAAMLEKQVADLQAAARAAQEKAQMAKTVTPTTTAKPSDAPAKRKRKAAAKTAAKSGTAKPATGAKPSAGTPAKP